MTKPRLLVACHDAGGAELVSSWLRRHLDEWRPEYILDGPAVGVFRRKLGEAPAHSRITSDVAFVLTGSSVSYALERLAIAGARAAGVRCATYLDHWKNYARRFVVGSSYASTAPPEFVLPDEVWVTDRWAADLAQRELPDANVLIKGNPYVEDVLAETRRALFLAPHVGIPPARPEHILFVHEPGRGKEFRRWLSRDFHNGQLLRERPHPSEMEAEHTLPEDLAWADVVVGCDSMALAVAARAGRRVVSVLSRGEELTIPWGGIERRYA